MPSRIVSALVLLGALPLACAFAPLSLPQHPFLARKGYSCAPGVSSPRRRPTRPIRPIRATSWAMRGQDSPGGRPEGLAGGDFAKKLGSLTSFIENSFSGQEQKFLRQLTVEQVLELRDLLGSNMVSETRGPTLSASLDEDLLAESRPLTNFRGARITISDEEYERLRLALLEAADLGDIGVIRSLLHTEEGQQVLMATDRNQHTALHVACVEGHLTVVKELADYGGQALLLQADNYGSTALHFASQRGKIEVVKYLAEVGGQELLIAEDRNGRTAAQLARYYGQPKVCEYLSKVKLENDFGR